MSDYIPKAALQPLWNHLSAAQFQHPNFAVWNLQQARAMIESIWKTQYPQLSKIERVASTNSVVCDSATDSEQVESNEKPVTKEKHEYVFFDSVRVGGSHLIVGPPGIGKTAVATAAAASDQFQEVVALTLEDSDGDQRPRFEGMLSGKKHRIITPDDWRDMENFVRQEMSQFLYQQAIQEEQQLAHADEISLRVQKRVSQKLKAAGLQDRVRFSQFLVLQRYIETCPSTVDCMVIEPFIHFEVNDVTLRRKLDLVIQVASKRGITLLFVHHTNKSGAIHGPEQVLAAFNDVLMLEKCDAIDSDGQNENRFRLIQKKSKFKDQLQVLTIRRDTLSPNTVDHALESRQSMDEYLYQKSLTKRERKQKAILKLLEEHGGRCELSALAAISQYSNIGSIKNLLKDLEDDGMVYKVDGRTWDLIGLMG